MTDANRPDLKGDWERQRRFLREGFGLSDDEIDRLVQEYDGMEGFLDAMIEYGDGAEDHLEGDESERVAVRGTEKDGQERFKPVGQDGPLDIYEIAGREMVPYNQVREAVGEISQELHWRNNKLDEMIDRVLDIDSKDSESRLSEDAKQAIDNIYEGTYKK